MKHPAILRLKLKPGLLKDGQMKGARFTEIGRGSYHQPFVADTNADPKPFTWTANPDKIIAAVSIH
jgi:hypothetical protein